MAIHSPQLPQLACAATGLGLLSAMRAKTDNGDTPDEAMCGQRVDNAATSASSGAFVWLSARMKGQDMMNDEPVEKGSPNYNR